MKTKFSLVNKGVVITGGGSGFGKAIAKTFATQGADVHILDLKMDAADDIAAQIKSRGFKATPYHCNIAHYKQVSELVNQISKVASVDVLINNAGIAHVGNIEACSEEDIDRLYQINIKGVYNCSKACIPLMKKNGGGVILNLASIASSVGLSDRFAYSMTKGAVLTMTYSIA